MRWFHILLVRVSGVFGRRRLDEQLHADLEFHLEQQTLENLGRGMPPSEARRAAAAALGGVDSAKEACRDQRRMPLEHLAHGTLVDAEAGGGHEEAPFERRVQDRVDEARRHPERGEQRDGVDGGGRPAAAAPDPPPPSLDLDRTARRSQVPPARRRMAEWPRRPPVAAGAGHGACPARSARSAARPRKRIANG